MTMRQGPLIRFAILYAVLFAAFGFASPFLPAFLAARGLAPEDLGIVLGAATAVRLISGPVAGRCADRLGAFRSELALCAVLAGSAALAYLAVHGFWAVMLLSLAQAAAFAALVPLADALSLAHALAGQGARGFEYGRVRGVGAAAFLLCTLLAGYAVGLHGLSAIIWLSALALLAVPIAALIVPAFPSRAASEAREAPSFNRPWLTLLRQRAFVCVALIAALVLGSHAMYDSFAVIRWIDTGVHPSTTGVLWAESVAAEVVVFFLIGPSLLRLLHPTGALALSALCGLLRWAVMAQTADVLALALIQPLHGFTFALLHLASMRIIADTVPGGLAATAQAVYGLVAVGGATALLTVASGWLYGRFGAAGFWAMGLLCVLALPIIVMLHRALASLVLSRRGAG
jgi:PPP family 3-phenylpropionic acid transporter